MSEYPRQLTVASNEDAGALNENRPSRSVMPPIGPVGESYLTAAPINGSPSVSVMTPETVLSPCSAAETEVITLA